MTLFRSSFLLLLLLSLGLKAQDVKVDTNRLLPTYAKLLPYTAIWIKSENAAGIAKDSLWHFGKASVGFQLTHGLYKMAQQPIRDQQVNFETERSMKLGKGLFYGRFHYTQQWEKDVQFSNVLNTYRGSPYLLADSIGGNWKKQSYDLELKAASASFFNEKLLLGFTGRLQVSSGARQNDPRPLSTNNQLHLLPAMIWSFNNKHSLGMNGLYERYREDVSLETKNTTINHYLYRFLGMGQLELPTTFTTSASRVYEGHRYGGSIQYQLKTDIAQWFNHLSYQSGIEKVAEGSSIPRKSGTWKQQNYSFTSQLSFTKNRFEHHLAANLNRFQDTGVEFHEIYNSGTKTWQTLLEAAFYLANTDRATFTYSLIDKNDSFDFSWMSETGVNYQSIEKNYLIPVSFQTISHVEIWTRGLKKISLGLHSMHVGLKAGYLKNLSQDLHYVPITADRTLAAERVLYPDHGYLSSNALISQAEVHYYLGHRSLGNAQYFIKADYTNRHNTQKLLYENRNSGHRHYFKFSVGAFY